MFEFLGPAVMLKRMVAARMVVIREPGDEGVLEFMDRELEGPAPGELLIRVMAAGLNRADLLQRRGFYPAPPGVSPDVPGLEFAGVVHEVGDCVAAELMGRRVMGIVAGGAMATHLIVPASLCMPIPEHVAFHEAAALPEAFLTAYDALRTQAALRVGESVLIHAAGSGVGSAAVQLAAAMGAEVIATSRTPHKLERATALGADQVILVEEGRFADAVRAGAGGGADVILDFVGGAYLAENLSALAPRGRLVVIGLLGGAKGALPLGVLLAKRAHVIGTVLRSRPLEEKEALVTGFLEECGEWIESGRLRAVIDRRMPMAEIRDAHRRLASNETLGKLILEWPAPA